MRIVIETTAYDGDGQEATAELAADYLAGLFTPGVTSETDDGREIEFAGTRIVVNRITADHGRMEESRRTV